MNVFGIVLFSVVETLALVIWLALNKLDTSVYSVSLLSSSILIVGLSLEHIIANNTARELPLLSFRDKPLGKIIGFSISETALWIIWLYLLTAIPVTAAALFVATIVLFVLFIFQHNIEFNVIEGRPIFFNLTNTKSIGISLVEAVGGTIWFYFANKAETTVSVAGVLAAGILLAVMLIEHFIQAAKIELVKA